MTIIDLLEIYNPKDYLYLGTLARHFGYKEGLNIVDDLTQQGYFAKTTLFRCPECDYAMFNASQSFTNDYLSEETTFCNACDREVKTSNLIMEPLWIKTDKIYKEE